MRKGSDHFEINGIVLSQENCGMRISADAVSFASWMKIEQGSKVLDIGTGCGILALLAAQKGAMDVRAVEIDEAAAATAAKNFLSSAFSEKIVLINQDVKHYAKGTEDRFHHIISNPPWYKNSPDSNDKARQQARIQGSLMTVDLLDISEKLLLEGGALSVILPNAEQEAFRVQAELRGWWASRTGRLFTKKGSPPVRFFTEWKRTYSATQRQDIYR